MSRRQILNSTGKYAVLALILVWSGLPILLMVLSSLKDPKTIFEFPPRFIFSPTAQNFVRLAERWPEFFKTLLNSFVITTGAAILTVLFSFLAGYGFSRFRSKSLSAFAFSMVFVRMLPPIVISIPLFPVLHALNLFDKHITLIILYTTFFVSLGTLLMKTFIDQIPRELEESANIDGASLGRILWSIILPLSVHGMIATSTFVIIFAWKEFLFAFLFTTTIAKTAPLIISEMMSSVTGVLWGPLFAAATLQLIPILIYVFLVQRFLVEGATVGSVKG